MTQSTNRAQHGEEVQAAARLDDAREGEKRAQERQDSARGVSAETAASVDMHAAKDQVAAREAWVKWLERDY